MSVFSSDAEVYDCIGGMFAEALTAPGIGEELAASGVVLLLEMTEPDSSITIDMANRQVVNGPSDAVEPTMRLRATADVAHGYWMGDVNVGVAIARGRIRVRGAVPTLIKLAAIAKPLFPLYRERFDARSDS